MNYTNEDVLDFAHEMSKQLDIHQNEKTSARNMTPGMIRNLVLEEIDRRLQILRMTTSTDMIKKQTVHMANFLMIWNNVLKDK